MAPPTTIAVLYSPSALPQDDFLYQLVNIAVDSGAKAEFPAPTIRRLIIRFSAPPAIPQTTVAPLHKIPQKLMARRCDLFSPTNEIGMTKIAIPRKTALLNSPS